MRQKALFSCGIALILAISTVFLRAQETPAPLAQGSIEHPYRGVQTIVPGVFRHYTYPVFALACLSIG